VGRNTRTGSIPVCGSKRELQGLKTLKLF